MTDPSVPPPPGTDTPVPADAAERAAASGRSLAPRSASAPRADALVPTTAMQQRAAERARRRQEQAERAELARRAAQAAAWVPAYAPGVANPAGGPVAAAPRPVYAGMVYGGPAYGSQPPQPPEQTQQPHAAAVPFIAPAHQAAPVPYAAPTYYVAPGVPLAPPPPLPRIRWTRRQTTAALLSSWVGQSLMSLATHFLTALTIIVGFALLLHLSGDPVGEIEADSFTSTIALWSTPERVWATALIGALLGGGLLVLGAVVSAQWGRSAGLAKAHRSAWLAWVCTTATTGLFGLAYWPGAIVFGMVGMVMSSTAALTLASMWGTLFGLLAMAVVLTGGVGLLYGWMFLSTSRPRIDPRALATAAAAAEEEAARARDEAELTGVRLRGEPA